MPKPWEKYSNLKQNGPDAPAGPWTKYSGQEKKGPSAWESAGRGGIQGLSLGFADELSAAAKAGYKVATDWPKEGEPGFKEKYKEYRDISRGKDVAAEEAHPGIYGTTRIAGAVAPAVAATVLSKGAAAPLALRALAPTTARGLAGLAAVEGIGYSEGENIEDLARDAALSGLMGFGVGKIAPIASRAVSGVLPGVGRGVEKAGQFIKEKAAVPAQRALGITKKMLKTDLKGRQAAQAGKMSLEEGVMGAFSTPQTMKARAEGLAKVSGEKMGEFLKKQSSGATKALKAGAKPQLREQFLFDPKRAIEDLERLRPKGISIGEPAKLNSIIDHAVETIKSHGTINAQGRLALRPIPWEEARKLKSMIQGMANYDTGMSREANNLKKAIGHKMRATFMGQLDEVATGRGGKQAFGTFQESTQKYAGASTMEDALKNRISSEEGNAIFGLRDVILGAGAIGGEGGAANLTKAGAVMVASKAARRYGSQVQAVGMHRLGEIIAKTPQALGKYAGPLQAAAKRGSQALATTHFILENKDPEYRKMVREITGDKAE